MTLLDTADWPGAGHLMEGLLIGWPVTNQIQIQTWNFELREPGATVHWWQLSQLKSHVVWSWQSNSRWTGCCYKWTGREWRLVCSEKTAGGALNLYGTPKRETERWSGLCWLSGSQLLWGWDAPHILGFREISLHPFSSLLSKSEWISVLCSLLSRYQSIDFGGDWDVQTPEGSVLSPVQFLTWVDQQSSKFLASMIWC